MKNLIRWEQDERDGRYWYGYVGKVILFYLNGFYPNCISNMVYTLELLDGRYEGSYSSFKNAKRGAERMFKKFLKEAGLEVTP